MLTVLLSGITLLVGILALFAAVLAMVYLMTSWRLSTKLRRTVQEMEKLLASTDFASREAPNAYGSVPPMRIHLRSVNSDSLPEDDLCQRIDHWLLEHSFTHVSDFVVNEDDESLRVYVSEDRLLVAAIRQPPEAAHPYTEFCFDLGRNQRGGVSNPPGCPVPLSDEAVGRYFAGDLRENFELLSRMWLEAKELVDTHEVQPVDINQVAAFFEQAHAAQMDARIAAGGISEFEIRAALSASGTSISDADIAEIQDQWQEAIQEHLMDCSSRGRKQHRSGREIIVVHDGIASEYLLRRVHELLKLFDEDLQQPKLMQLTEELRGMLRRFRPREAIARFRPLLPFSARYDLVDQIKKPVEADLYAFPPPFPAP